MLSFRGRLLCLRFWTGASFTVRAVRSFDGIVVGTRYGDRKHWYSISHCSPSAHEVRLSGLRCYRLLATLRPLLHLHRALHRPTRLFPNPRWNGCSFAHSSSANGGSSSNGSGNFKLLLCLYLSLALLFRFTFFGPSFQLEAIDYPTFLQLLERGEVKRVSLILDAPFAAAELHGDNPRVLGKTVAFPIREGPEALKAEIRQKEKSWGIPVDDAVPIEGPVKKIHLIGPLYVLIPVLCIGSLLLFLSGKQLFGFLRKTRLRVENHKLEVNRSGASKTATEQGNHTVGRSDSSRYAGGHPFSWDPFSGFKTIKPVVTDVKFKDVAGLHASKQEVMEFVSYLKDPRKYQALGAKLPKGALLLGPPGTGKTLLVKALANEAGVPFFSMAGSEFVEVIGGLGASRIRQLFRVARSNSPAIIFIDELDSIGRRRHGVDTGSRRGSHSGRGEGCSEMEQTLNQLLAEMDGMDTGENTIVFAATNRADLLDKALLRAGRFDRHIYIDLPNLQERKELFEMYTAKYLVASSVDQSNLIEHFATLTPGMSGADIAGLCNEAALIAARRNNFIDGVTLDDFEAAYERILAGAARRSNPLSPPERRVAAVQEAGRALVAWLLPHCGLSLVKVSIVPRIMAGTGDSAGLGFTHLAPEERRLFNTEELSDRMAILLGGRAAEQVIFNAVSDASQRYLQQASSLALKQVREWGMSKTIGNLSFEDTSSESGPVLKPYSQRTQALIEMEAQQLVSAAFTRCVQLLQANKTKLQRLIEALLQREVLSYQELNKICSDTSEDAPSDIGEA